MNKILLIIILFFIWTLDVQSQTDSINSEKIQQRGLFKVLNIKRIKNIYVLCLEKDNRRYRVVVPRIKGRNKNQNKEKIHKGEEYFLVIFRVEEPVPMMNYLDYSTVYYGVAVNPNDKCGCCTYKTKSLNGLYYVEDENM